MKKLTFKVSNQKEFSIVALIKEVNKISCRINIDLDNGFVTVENVNDSMIDTVIDLINHYYKISSVDINNTITAAMEPEVASEIAGNIQTTEDLESSPPITIPNVLGPQSENDLIIKKVEFQNEYIEQLVNKFLRTVYWAMYSKNIPEKELGEFIFTSINEISMRYNKKEPIAFSIGDIVDCNFGLHLKGEINGYHVPAIVCNISSTGMAYVVPITNMQNNLTSHSYLIFNVPEDIIYENNYYTGSIALLDKSKYVRPERFHSVIGKTTPEFLAKLLEQLSYTFDFTKFCTKSKKNLIDIENVESETFETKTQPTSKSAIIETDINKTIATPKENDTTIKVKKLKAPAKKIGGEESALLETIGSAFDKLDVSKKVEEQIDDFLNDIGMPTTEKMVRQSFVIACNIKKINYENVILELHNLHPKVKEDIIKASLKESFKIWLKKYPELAKKCPKISLMSVLKIFAKKFA